MRSERSRRPTDRSVFSAVISQTTDGRTARALRTREAIVDACIALVDEGDLRPTAPRVAERAGVSVRSVFQHFDDLEALYAAVADRMVERLSHLMTTVDADAPLERRVADVVYQRSLLLEAITPIRRAAAVHAPFSAEVTARLQSGHDFLRGEVERLFEPELSRCDGADRTRLLDALDTVLSWPSWENLRTLNHRSVAEARAVLDVAIRALVGSTP
jgi:AcrR family transcriptional regulator